jgi:hypothetical protein
MNQIMKNVDDYDDSRDIIEQAAQRAERLAMLKAASAKLKERKTAEKPASAPANSPKLKNTAPEEVVTADKATKAEAEKARRIAERDEQKKLRAAEREKARADQERVKAALIEEKKAKQAALEKARADKIEDAEKAKAERIAAAEARTAEKAKLEEEKKLRIAEREKAKADKAAAKIAAKLARDEARAAREKAKAESEKQRAMEDEVIARMREYKEAEDSVLVALYERGRDNPVFAAAFAEMEFRREAWLTAVHEWWLAYGTPPAA